MVFGGGGGGGGGGGSYGGVTFHVDDDDAFLVYFSDLCLQAHRLPCLLLAL